MVGLAVSKLNSRLMGLAGGLIALSLAWLLFLSQTGPVAQAAGERCFANNGKNVFSSTNASAVQLAVDQADVGALVKVAGKCAGVQTRQGMAQTLYISRSITLQGGYTTTNWATSWLTMTTILNANYLGRVIKANVPVTISQLTIQNAILGDDYSSGGGAYFGAKATVMGSTFNNNRGQYGGGAYFAAAATVTGSTFNNNSGLPYTGGFGGGAYFAAAATVTGSTFNHNFSVNIGGGAYFSGGATVTGSTFNNNLSANVGGGAYFGAAATVTGSTFNNNSGELGGGGVYFWGGATVTGSTFSNNISPKGNGSGAYFHKAPVMVVNSLFYDNDSSSIDTFDVDATIIHTTIDGSAGWMAVYAPMSSITMTNTIIANSDLGCFCGINNKTKNNLLYNVNNKSGFDAPSNITGQDPLFISPQTGDYRLRTNSPAIGKGKPTDVLTDYFGRVRSTTAPTIGYSEGADSAAVSEPTQLIYLPVIMQ